MSKFLGFMFVVYSRLFTCVFNNKVASLYKINQRDDKKCRLKEKQG